MENKMMTKEDFEVSLEEIKQEIIEVLQTIYDPEIPVNIYELGLIYAIEVNEDRNVEIKMTLTAPGCPVAQSFPGEVEGKVSAMVESVNDVHVELVWEPPWDREMMDEAAKLQLGMF